MDNPYVPEVEYEEDVKESRLITSIRDILKHKKSKGLVKDLKRLISIYENDRPLRVKMIPIRVKQNKIRTREEFLNDLEDKKRKCEEAIRENQNILINILPKAEFKEEKIKKIEQEETMGKDECDELFELINQKGFSQVEMLDHGTNTEAIMKCDKEMMTEQKGSEMSTMTDYPIDLHKCIRLNEDTILHEKLMTAINSELLNNELAISSTLDSIPRRVRNEMKSEIEREVDLRVKVVREKALKCLEVGSLMERYKSLYLNEVLESNFLRMLLGTPTVAPEHIDDGILSYLGYKSMRERGEIETLIIEGEGYVEVDEDESPGSMISSEYFSD